MLFILSNWASLFLMTGALHPAFKAQRIKTWRRKILHDCRFHTSPPSPFFCPCRWNWQAAVCLTTSTQETMWRWQSSWAWSFPRGEASSRRVRQRMEPAQHPHLPSPRPLSQVGIAIAMSRLAGRTFTKWLSSSRWCEKTINRSNGI